MTSWNQPVANSPVSRAGESQLYALDSFKQRNRSGSCAGRRGAVCIASRLHPHLLAGRASAPPLQCIPAQPPCPAAQREQHSMISLGGLADARHLLGHGQQGTAVSSSRTMAACGCACRDHAPRSPYATKSSSDLPGTAGKPSSAPHLAGSGPPCRSCLGHRRLQWRAQVKLAQLGRMARLAPCVSTPMNSPQHNCAALPNKQPVPHRLA